MRPESTLGRLKSGISSRRQAELGATLQHFQASQEQAERAENIRDSVVVPLIDFAVKEPAEIVLLGDALELQNGYSPKKIRRKPLVLFRPTQECTAIRKIKVNGRTSMLAVREIAPVSITLVKTEIKLPLRRVLGGVVDIEIDPDHVSFSSVRRSKVGLPKGDMTLEVASELIDKLKKTVRMPKPRVRKLGREFE
ncbi:hypothetical protein M1349_05640 [Patescibacteria group bacterium]|nr:hypothetical protein [Patescibacteria group bacterium]